MAVLKQRFDSWMDGTMTYRVQQKDAWDKLCCKIDKISEKVFNLPCKQGEESYKGLANQIKAIWGLMIIGIGALVSDWFRKN